MDELNRFTSIDLNQLNTQAELLRRFDTKYLVRIDQLPQLLVSLPQTTRVLENNGTRSTPYSTHYYDTAELHTYYDHLKRRRKRFKIRTRHYGNPQQGYLEIKIKKPRGQTEKVRWGVDVSSIGDTLGIEQQDLLNDALMTAHYPPLAHQYSRTLTTHFLRTTLFEPASLERITIDSQLHASISERSLQLGPHHAIVEIKSPTQVGHSHRIFTHLGIRPVSVSKYCLAMTALHPALGGAPWREPLRIMGTSTATPEG